MANEPDMNPEQGGVDPREGTPPKHTGSKEATGINQPDPLVEAPSGDSSSQKAEIIDPQAEDSSKIERVRQGLKVDSKGNFVMTPVTAGGPPVSEDPKSENILNAQIPGRPVGERRAPVPGGVRRGGGLFGGLRKRVLAAVVATGLVMGGGAAYVANQQASSGENNPGGVPTQPVGETPTGIATKEPTAEPTKEPTATETPTQIPAETLTPEVPSLLSQYPEKIIDPQTYGKVTIAHTEESASRINCGEGVCVPMKDIVPNEDIPDFEKKLNDGVDYGFYLAWLSKNNYSSEQFSFDQYKQKLYETTEDLSFTIKADEGSEIRGLNDAPSVKDVIIDPRKPVAVVWVSTPYPYMKYVGGNSTSSGVSLGYRTLGNNELIIEIFDGSGGGRSDRVNGVVPANFQAASHLSAALAFLSEQGIQESSAQNIPISFSSLPREKIFQFHTFLVPDKSNGNDWDSILHSK